MTINSNSIQAITRDGSVTALKKALRQNPEGALVQDAHNGQTPLMEALCLSRHNESKVQALLPFSDLRQTNKNGYSPLMLALCHHYPTVIVEAMVPGSDLLQRSTRSETALSSALRNGANLDLVLNTLIPGSDATHTNVLMLALQHDRTFRVAQALLPLIEMDQGYRDADGRTVLHYAVEYQTDVEHVRQVLAVSDPKQVDHEGQTALHLAARRGAPMEVINLLIERCNPNANDVEGYTALILAMMMGHHEAFEALLPATNLEKKNRAGRNALFFLGHVGSQAMKDQVREQHQRNQEQAMKDVGPSETKIGMKQRQR